MSLTGLGSILLLPLGPLWALEEDVLFTEVAHKGNTDMTEKSEVDFDIDLVRKLLDILLDVKDIPELAYIKQAALSQLKHIEQQLWEQLNPEEAEAQKKAQEEREKAEEERQKQLKEAQQKEYQESQKGREQATLLERRA